MFVKHPDLSQFVLLLQQNVEEVPAEKTGSSGDQINETPLVFRHAVRFWRTGTCALLLSAAAITARCTADQTPFQPTLDAPTPTSV